MNTSYVEVLRKLDTPIIVITEDSEGEYDAEEEFDSDAEIVELEKERGASVQKNVIDEEEAEDENVREKECLEENNPELENAEQNGNMEKEAVEGATENEETITKQDNGEKNNQQEENEINVYAETEPVNKDVNTGGAGEVKEEGPAEAAKKSTGQSSNEPVENVKTKRENSFEKTEDAEIKVPAKIDRALLETLVSLHGGWHDAELKKNIKQTPKGWQLISV